MKRLNGFLLALPLSSAADEVLQLAQVAGPDDVFGPSATVEVAGATWNLESPLVEPTEAEGRRIQVLLLYAAASLANHLKELADCDMLDITLFSEEITLVPLPEALIDAAVSWIHAGQHEPRVAFYSADEGFAPKQRAKARPRGGTASEEEPARGRKKVTVASLAESLEKVATALPTLANQVKTLSERTERLEKGVDQGSSQSPQRTGGFPMRGLGGAPALSSFVQRMPPQRNTSTQKIPEVKTGVADADVEDLAEELVPQETSDIAQALMVQKGQTPTGACDAIYQQMSRRMFPALPADLTPKELATRGVTACQYLERFGGFGRVREMGHIAWQVGLALDQMQQGSDLAARDTLALLLTCLEQTAMDGGNMQIGLLLSLSEEPPQNLFSNRSLAMGARPKAFAPLADQRWVTTALQYLKELDTIANRRSEVANQNQSQKSAAPKEEPNPKKRTKGRGRGAAKKQLEEAEECRTAFSSFLARTLHAQPSGLGPSSAVFPIPLPHFGLFRGSGPQLQSAKWWTLCRKRILHILVVALNYLHSGLRHVDMTELGRAPSAVHRAIYSRLSASITACDTPGLFPLPPGRAGPEFIARTGLWPTHDFLEDELWLPFLEPAILSLPDQPSAIGPDFSRESKAENLRLAKVWDVKGLLGLFSSSSPPRFYCRVFNAHKSLVVDRQIGDRRWANAHEMHPRGPSSKLPSGPLCCSLHCQKGSTLVGCISDRKDFYHQCSASRSRTFTNCLPFPFEKEHFTGSRALDELVEEISAPTRREVHGDRYGMTSRKPIKEKDITHVYAGFRSLFQGDHLGVEYALSAHETMLKRGGLLCDGLVIDDFFTVSRERAGTPLLQAKSVEVLERAEGVYSEAGVFGSDEKTIRGAERFKIIVTEIGSDEKCRGAGVITASAPLEKRFALASLSLRLAQLPVISREIASRVAGSWISVLMFRRPMTCLLHHLFALGAKSTKEARDVVPLRRSVADELVLASALSPLCFTDLSTPYAEKIYATDASLSKGAITSMSVSAELSEIAWLGGDRKGGYTKLEEGARVALRAVGEYDENDLQAEEPCFAPCKTIDFSFDFVEICGGSGIVSQKAARLGLNVCTPIDISRSPHFDLKNLDLLWWILGMIKSRRFRSVCCEPPCTTFSPAQHPASRSYAEPLGFDRKDPKTLVGNILAFRCLIICWFAFLCDIPALLEQPRLTKMAWLAAWRYLLSLGFKEAILASCMFGSPHKKEFRLLLHGLESEFLNVRCCGGHQHLRIEGKYTKASGAYVDGVAERIAFHGALRAKEEAAEREVSVAGLESVILNDILAAGRWENEAVWNWRYPSHINVYESYSLVSLLRKLLEEGGDLRFVALLDSRVAKGAHAKGRSSSHALRCSLQKACALQLAGNLHPSLGFAPTRLNTAHQEQRLA
eukprot:s3468_g5.t1